MPASEVPACQLWRSQPPQGAPSAPFFPRLLLGVRIGVRIGRLLAGDCWLHLASSGPTARKRGASPNRYTQPRLPLGPTRPRPRLCGASPRAPPGSGPAPQPPRDAALARRSPAASSVAAGKHLFQASRPVPFCALPIDPSAHALVADPLVTDPDDLGHLAHRTPRSCQPELVSSEGVEARAVLVVGLFQITRSEVILAVLPVYLKRAAHGSIGVLNERIYNQHRSLLSEGQMV